MKTHAAPGGLVGRGTKRRGLLLFAVLLVIAQIMLFAVLRQRSKSAQETAAPSVPPPTATPNQPQNSLSPAPSPTPPTPAPTPPTSPSPQLENEPLKTTGDKTASNADSETAAESADDDKDDDKDDPSKRRDRDKHDRVDRERERRERLQAERDKERERDQQARERARLEAERDRARLEAEKDRARLEAERAEKARIDIEREKAQLEAERARLLAERKASQATQDRDTTQPSRPTGSPDVLVVLVSRSGSGSLSREEIRNIYFGKTTFWPNNTPVRAFNRPAGSPAGRKFFRSILGTSSSAFQEHWNGLQLSGGGIAPQTVSSAESIIARVAGASGAIGYVLESELPGDVSGVRLIRFK